MKGWSFRPPAAGRSLLLVATGDFGSKALAFLATALTVRFATPEQMGILALFVTIQTILLQASDLGIGVSLVKHVAASPKDSDGERRFLRAAFLVKGVLALGIGIPCILLGSWVFTSVLGRPAFAQPLRFAALSLMGGTLLAFCVSYCQARQWFVPLSLLRIGEGAAKLGLILALVLLAGFSVRGVLWIYVLVPSLLGLAGFLRIPKRFLSAHTSPEEVRTLFHISKWILVASVASMLAFQVDTLLLASLSDPQNLGVYGAGLRLSGPLQMAGAVLTTVFFPLAMQHRSRSEAAAFFRRTLGLTLPLGLLGMIASLAGGPLLARLFPQYPGLPGVFLPLGIGLSCFIALGVGQLVVLALDRPELTAWVSSGQLALNVAGNLILIPRLGALGAALSTGVTWVATSLAYLLLVRNLTTRSDNGASPGEADPSLAGATGGFPG